MYTLIRTKFLSSTIRTTYPQGGYSYELLNMYENETSPTSRLIILDSWKLTGGYSYELMNMYDNETSPTSRLIILDSWKLVNIIRLPLRKLAQ